MQPSITTEVLDLLDGLYAYDTGCVDSGIHDPVRKAELAQTVGTFSLEEATDIALALYGEPPYTSEDVDGFLDWWYEQFVQHYFRP